MLLLLQIPATITVQMAGAPNYTFQPLENACSISREEREKADFDLI